MLLTEVDLEFCKGGCRSRLEGGLSHHCWPWLKSHSCLDPAGLHREPSSAKDSRSVFLSLLWGWQTSWLSGQGGETWLLPFFFPKLASHRAWLEQGRSSYGAALPPGQLRTAAPVGWRDGEEQNFFHVLGLKEKTLTATSMPWTERGGGASTPLHPFGSTPCYWS